MEIKESGIFRLTSPKTFRETLLCDMEVCLSPRKRIKRLEWCDVRPA